MATSWWSWRESNPRPSGEIQARYDHSQVFSFPAAATLSRVKPKDLVATCDIF